MRYAQFESFEIALPEECVTDCSHSGPCDNDVAFWRDKIDFSGISKEMLVNELRQYGAWDFEELQQLSIEELQCKIIWIGANDLADEKFYE